MKKVISILSCLLIIIGVQGQDPFIVYGKVNGARGSEITLTRGDTILKVIKNKSIYDFDLDYDSEYKVTFKRDGYITKGFDVNTHVPKDRILSGFAPFEAHINLKIRQHEGDEPKSVGLIFFDSRLDDFTAKK